MAEITPLLEQYQDIKKNYQDAILLFRMGDFYETFYDDAKFVSNALNIVLTAREYSGKDVPLAGFPIKAADQYIIRLVKTGTKVAVCEQLEEAGKGIKLVKRGVVEVITPGTIMREALLNDKENNYIASVYCEDGKMSLSCADITTGEMFASSFTSLYDMKDYLLRISPSEILCDERMEGLEFEKERRLPHYNFDEEESTSNIKRHFDVLSVEGLGFDGSKDHRMIPAGVLLKYLNESQQNALKQIRRIELRRTDNIMTIDSQTLRNLEIFKRMNGDEENSFISVIDETNTSMGGRKLRKMLANPMNSIDKIEYVQSNVQVLADSPSSIEEIGRILKRIGDIERINTRIAVRRCTPRDLIHLSAGLSNCPAVIDALKKISLGKLLDKSNECEKICKIIDVALDKELVLSNEKERYFKSGYNDEYDRIKNLSINTSELIYKMEQNERELTGINNLKIGYNSVMGYYIEITNSYKDKVPVSYIRKQTLKNAERYINEELKKHEQEIISSEERLNQMEREMLAELIDKVAEYFSEIADIADALSLIDLYNSYAKSAYENDYVKPELSDSNEIYIEDGRHPVVEHVEKDNRFTPNSLCLNGNIRVILLTGPNMSGKSTYLRQNAIIIYMAHLGMFVPAKSARIPLTDRIFTRIGASDDISRGVSTFMAEMLESANIINNMTKKSFIVLDEIGRGTSTFDGLAIAWAILEYIHNDSSAPMTLFATHYHELTELSRKLSGLKNFTTKVRRTQEKIIFLRKIVEGFSDESYGIEVAKMAGMPKEIVENAYKILSLLKESEENVRDKMRDINQLELFRKDEKDDFEKYKNIALALSEANIDDMSPIEALLFLNDLKKSSNR